LSTAGGWRWPVKAALERLSHFASRRGFSHPAALCRATIVRDRIIGPLTFLHLSTRPKDRHRKGLIARLCLYRRSAKQLQVPNEIRHTPSAKPPCFAVLKETRNKLSKSGNTGFNRRSLPRHDRPYQVTQDRILGSTEHRRLSTCASRCDGANVQERASSGTRQRRLM